jgi:uncharacterized membrane protein
MYLDETGTCDKYGGWATRGWWTVPPDADVYALGTPNRDVYFYAYSADGKLTWEGTGHHLYVDPDHAFQSCRDISRPTGKLVGAREIDMGSAFTVYTVTLSGPAPSTT